MARRPGGGLERGVVRHHLSLTCRPVSATKNSKLHSSAECTWQSTLTIGVLPFPDIFWWSMGDPTSLFTLDSSLPEAVHSSGRLLRWCSSSCAGRLQGLKTLHVIGKAVINKTRRQLQDTALLLL